MNWKKFFLTGILGGIVFFAVEQIVYNIVKMVFPFDMLSLAGMRAITDPTMILYFVYPFVMAFMLALAYSNFRLEGNAMRKGMKLGMVLFIALIIPGSFLIFSSMDYPVGFTVNHLAGGLLGMTALGIVTAKFME